MSTIHPSSPSLPTVKIKGQIQIKGCLGQFKSSFIRWQGEISQITLLTSSLSSSSRVEMEKAHILVGFCTKLLTKEAQAVTSRNENLAILKCPHSIQRPIFVIQSLKAKKHEGGELILPVGAELILPIGGELILPLGGELILPSGGELILPSGGELVLCLQEAN
ncbi:hypothetical protein Tco_0541036 [Tanacetum coccineum]